MSAIFVVTKIRNSCQYIKFSIEEQDAETFKETFVENFVLKALEAHNIENVSPDIIIEFYDNNNAQITEADLFDIVGQKFNCGCFLVVLKVLSENYKKITSAQIRDFLNSKPEGQNFSADNLSKKLRIKLMQYLVQLIDEKIGDDVSQTEIEITCRATIELFPSLGDKNGGITLLYSGRSGYLYDKIRNKKRKFLNYENQNRGDADNLQTNIIDYTSEESEQLMQYFKNYVIGNDSEEFYEKLSASVKFRRCLLIDPPEPIHKMFGFYFADPKIILYDFELMFPDIDASALIDIWPTIKDQPAELHDTEIDVDINLPTVETDVLCFIHLLKFLPARRVKLKNALKSFIKFCTDPNFDPVRLIESKNPHPIIIAIFGTAMDVKYYIGWQDRIFSVPNTFNFIQVVDMFIKIHKIFNIDFENKIKPVMNLINHYIFKFPLEQITPTIQNAANQLKLPQSKVKSALQYLEASGSSLQSSRP